MNIILGHGLQAAAFHVFQLEPPAPERPYVKGLLDPCTNSMAAPNIPAEVLYDKQVSHSSVQGQHLPQAADCASGTFHRWLKYFPRLSDLHMIFGIVEAFVFKVQKPV